MLPEQEQLLNFHGRASKYLTVIRQEDLLFKANGYAFKPIGYESISDASMVITDKITESSMPIRQIKRCYVQENKALCKHHSNVRLADFTSITTTLKP